MRREMYLGYMRCNLDAQSKFERAQLLLYPGRKASQTEREGILELESHEKWLSDRYNGLNLNVLMVILAQRDDLTAYFDLPGGHPLHKTRKTVFELYSDLGEFMKRVNITVREHLLGF